LKKLETGLSLELLLPLLFTFLFFTLNFCEGVQEG
jgi:hypothetical protein